MASLASLALPLLIAASVSAPSVSTASAFHEIQVESLGLVFEAPVKWRLSDESTSEQLVFYPGKSKETPIFRVRTFHGDFSPEDRLSEMTRGLSEEESKVHFVSSEKWTHERRRYETATVIYKKGSQEWHGSFTLVTQPRRVQHGFWLFGREKDLQRQWETIKASIVSAKSIKQDDGDSLDSDEDEAESPEETKSVWNDKKAKLGLASWPAGFAPDEKSLERLTKDGLRILPTDERAHKATEFLLTCELGAKEGSSMDAAATLHSELGTKSSVSDLRRIPVRVGGEEAALVKWTEETTSDVLVHEVHFVQRGDRALRIDYTAEERWSRARSRRSLLKDFIAGVTFD